MAFDQYCTCHQTIFFSHTNSNSDSEREGTQSSASTQILIPVWDNSLMVPFFIIFLFHLNAYVRYCVFAVHFLFSSNAKKCSNSLSQVIFKQHTSLMSWRRNMKHLSARPWKPYLGTLLKPRAIQFYTAFPAASPNLQRTAPCHIHTRCTPDVPDSLSHTLW